MTKFLLFGSKTKSLSMRLFNIRSWWLIREWACGSGEKRNKVGETLGKIT